MSFIKQAVILCGGLGTRLYPLTINNPKPMVMIKKKPFLFYLIEQCRMNGIKDILLLVGYKHEKLKRYFQDGKKLDVNIRYHYNPHYIQTYKRIYDAKKYLKENFLLLYADNYSSLNLHHLICQHKETKSKFTISVCKKKNANLKLNFKNKKISKYFYKKNENADYVDIGYMILNKKILLSNYTKKNVSFSKFIYNLVLQKKAFFYLNETGYQSISDPKRYEKSKKFFYDKYILIDRDGVLNHKNKSHYYVRNINELKINFSFINRLKKLIGNKDLICITNQAGVSTGDLRIEDLKKINNKIKIELKKKGINIISFFMS